MQGLKKIEETHHSLLQHLRKDYELNYNQGSLCDLQFYNRYQKDDR